MNQVSCLSYLVTAASSIVNSVSCWVKHRIKDKYVFFYNLESQNGTWVEPEDFVHDSTQLTKEDIQVGYLQRDLLTLRTFLFISFIYPYS